MSPYYQLLCWQETSGQLKKKTQLSKALQFMAILITIYICPDRKHSPFSLFYSRSRKNNQVFLSLKNANTCIFPFSYCAPLVSYLKLLQSRGCIHNSNETAAFKSVEDIVCVLHQIPGQGPVLQLPGCHEDTLFWESALRWKNAPACKHWPLQD